ncbi:MAG: hypothetical protein ABI763_12415 [Bacteroidota bacterium]
MNFVNAQTPPLMQWSTHVDCTNPGVPFQSKDWTFKLRHTRDGGYIAAGYSHYHNTFRNENILVPTLFRLDPNGNLKWQHYYDLGIDVESYSWAFNDVVEDANGFFVAVGQIGTLVRAPFRQLIWILQLQVYTALLA